MFWAETPQARPSEIHNAMASLYLLGILIGRDKKRRFALERCCEICWRHLTGCGTSIWCDTEDRLRKAGERFWKSPERHGFCGLLYGSDDPVSDPRMVKESERSESKRQYDGAFP